MDNKININSLFSTLLATKKIDLSKLNIVANKFKKTFESDVKTSINTETLLDKDSMNYLNIELTTILSHLLKPYCKNFVFKISGLWINKYEDKDYQGSHVHPSDFSFIVYYKTNKSHTVFNSPFKNLLETIDNQFFEKQYEPKLNKDNVIVFPSYLEHWVKPNSDNITIAGNIKIEDIKK